MLLSLILLLVGSYEPNPIDTWDKFYDSMEISLKGKKQECILPGFTDETIKYQGNKIPAQAVLSIYACDAHTARNYNALEFVLMKGCLISLRSTNEDTGEIEYDLLKDACLSNDAYLAALMLLYEPLNFRYKLNTFVSQSKTNYTFAKNTVLKLRDILLTRIKKGYKPLPEYTSEYIYNLYAEWGYYF